MEKNLQVQSARPLSALIKADPAAIETILERSLHGETLREIAASYGVSHQALQKQIIKHAPDEWRDTQAAKSMCEYEDVMTEMEQASDLVAIARTRELVRSKQWQLERLIPRLYGNKQEVTVHHHSDLAERIQAAERRIIDVQAEVVPPLSSEPPGG